ncbi:uncharacterized protein LOC134226699 [Armigeres subalbatus]|uniref:uncharacterized protein LOC134226699 n=1 Tax=Armigeres subalbatus TaxID=124917 RepID=UPI002ECFD003
MQFDEQRGLAAPNWMNDRFLQEVIRKAKNDGSIALCHDCKVRPGGRDGVQHASNLFRTTVHYRSKHAPHQEHATDLIVKMDRGFGSDVQFVKEIRMYREVLPAMEQVLKTAGGSLSVPRYFYSSNEPRKFIVMEDLFPSGWIQKGEINSIEDATLCVKAIAKFHAASYILSKKNHNLVSSCTRMDMDIHKMVSTIGSLAEMLRARPGSSQIGVKLHSMKPRFQSKLKQIYNPNNQPHSISVLNHGELNVTNLWYRVHPDSEVAMIDFQNCHWGTPAIDLLCLFDLVLDRSLRRAQSDRLVRVYYEWFMSYLGQTGHMASPFTLQELVKELRNWAVLELLHLAQRNQLRNSGPTSVNSIDGETTDTEIEQDLSELMRRGIFD